jgi:DNA-directed RNA polymerase specialized sigma24 family protein
MTQLQALIHAQTGSSNGTGGDALASDVRSLTGELAERIFRDPERWGYASIAPEFRDDAVADAYTALLFALPELRGKQPIADWFSETVESKFRLLWALEERQVPERERLASEAVEQRATAPGEEAPAKRTSLFEDAEGIWPGFETAFPRDAFVLRLRYLMQRKPAEMAVMLDAPSERAIGMRLDRARDRFKMYCEQQGIKRSENDALVEQVSEEAKE